MNASRFASRATLEEIELWAVLNGVVLATQPRNRELRAQIGRIADRIEARTQRPVIRLPPGDVLRDVLDQPT